VSARVFTFRGRGITTHTDAPVVPPEPPKPRPSHRPVLPPWLRQRDELASALRWAVLHAAHLGAFHAVRLPKYGARLLVYSPRGAYRGIASGARWLVDADGLTVQRHAITSLAGSVMGHERSGHVSQYRSLAKEHAHRVRGRCLLLIAAVVFGLPALASLGPRIPALAVVVAVGLCGWHGRRKDRPIVDQGTIEAPGARPMTPDMVIAAFSAAGLGSEKDPITFAAPGVYRDGKGFAARIVLPIGVTVAKAVERLEVIASGLDVQKVQVFLGQMPVASERSERRLMLWVADEDPYAKKTPITPLAKMDRLDFWKGFPFGLDAKGALVAWSLVFSGLLVGAKTRMGKTFAARIPVAAAALDPNVRIYVVNLKGDNAWKPFQTVAHFYRSGVRMAVMQATVEMLKGMVEEMNRRQELIETLPHDRCPESKLTPALARDKRLNMGLIVVAIDEVQRLLECDKPAWEEDEPSGRGRPKKPPTIADLAKVYLTDLAKVGSSAGIMLDVATQDPNSEVLPTGIRRQLGKRFALKVLDYQASNCILGTGCSAKGWDASKLEDRHKGVGWLLGSDDSELSDSDAQIVRTHFMDLPTLQAICDRGRELRIKAGTLTGEAAGEDLVVETPARPFLDDVRAVFGIGETKLWSETIALRLAERWPETYDGWDASDLGVQLGRHNIKTVQVWGKTPDDTEANRKGISLDQLTDAVP
jgi:S-DNA-T family DNA segregation ATPase FtsK/SpoIIIE